MKVNFSRVNKALPPISIKSAKAGFNLIQIMISLVVLSLGFLAIAMMVLRTQEAKLRSQRLQNAQSLAKLKISTLAGLEYEALATGSTESEKIQYGAPSQEVVSYGPLNRVGKTQSESSEGPFVYTLSFVVCLDDTEGGIDAPSEGGKPCGDVESVRPDSLACDVSHTDEGEVEIRVLATYTDRQGNCHKVTMSNIQVDLNL
ncbi:MAG: hypothetical protein KDD48_00035 [Bdellovibrionales bacterium]|nr:hypothetical protein [Bdellovibrionales bacterium]